MYAQFWMIWGFMFMMQHQCTLITQALDKWLMLRSQLVRTKHLDIRYFACTELMERDLIVLKPILTSDNNSDALTKALGRQLFTRHKSTLLGHCRPTYV